MEKLAEWSREPVDTDDPGSHHESDDDSSSAASAEYERPPKILRLTQFGRLMSKHVISMSSVGFLKLSSH